MDFNHELHGAIDKLKKTCRTDAEVFSLLRPLLVKAYRDGKRTARRPQLPPLYTVTDDGIVKALADMERYGRDEFVVDPTELIQIERHFDNAAPKPEHSTE